MADKLNIADYDRVLYRLAVIIDQFGDVYLPIYERLEREREDLVGRRDALERIAQRIKSGPPERPAQHR